MTYLPYILAAYAAAAIVLGGLVTWAVTDLRTQARRLRALEDAGYARHSGSTEP